MYTVPCSYATFCAHSTTTVYYIVPLLVETPAPVQLRSYLSDRLETSLVVMRASKS